MTRPLRSTDPARIGDYELTGRIGGGGMGDVFLGRSPSGRSAAVKVVRDLLADDPRFRERFRREVAAARSVSGAYTAAVLDADPDAERPWLATAYIDGPSLLDRVAGRGALSAEETRTLGAGLAEALRDIHRAGLVHRDLKPGNVLLAADGPRLIDFGIIRAEDGEGLTETGYVLGSAGYMAPEQAAGGEATAAADVYSLGAVLTFAATGHGPFGDGPTPGVLLRQAAGDLDISAVPEGLREVVARCLDVLPGQRPTTNALLELLGRDAIAEGATADALVFSKGKKTPRAKDRTKTRTKNPELDDLLTGMPSSTQNAEIARTPTTLMRAEPGKGAKNAKGAKNKQRVEPQPMPTRRKFLLFGMGGAAVAAFGVGIAAVPAGDAKKTSGAETNDTGATSIPTTKASGYLGGPMKSPVWSHAGVYSDFLALSGNTLLVRGATLSAFDAATRGPVWTVPKGTYAHITDGNLSTVGDTVYETRAAGGDLVAVSVANGSETWSAPGPSSWLTRGLIGASSELVVGWSDIEGAKPTGEGLWGVDPQSHQVRWSTAIGTHDGAPHYSAETGLVLLSDSRQNKLTAYSTQTGHQVWTAQDTTSSDKPIATGIGSHGKTVYWATTRLYAYDAQGRALWPTGVANSQDGNFHAVVADDTTVYAASTASLSENVIAAYRADDGAPLWRTSWPKDSRQDPALECRLVLSGGKLYVGDRVNGVLIALDAKTGETLWQFRTPAGAAVDVDWQIVANDQYVFAGYGTTVYGFKAD